MPVADGLPRWVESTIAASGLAVAAPLLGLSAAAVWLSSPGPILFRQNRVGRHGRPFVMLKFRSMRMLNTGPQVTSSGDRRITWVGGLLRRTKLDELPELWNVLRGDMSLVGPRPEVPAYVDLDDRRWQRVLQARPGLTDPVTLRLRNEEELLAEVTGDRVRFYLDVLQPWKLDGYGRFLGERTWQADLEVLVKTVVAVLKPTAASPPTAAELREVAEQQARVMAREVGDDDSQRVRRLRPGDAAQVASLHLRTFPQFFLSSLGVRFLTHLYRGIAECPVGFGFVLEQDGELVGFVAGGDDLAAVYRWLIKRRLFRFGMASAWPCLRRPQIVPRILRAFSAPSDAERNSSDCATLMSLGVASSGQRGGKGTHLVDAFVHEAGRRGARWVELSTDRDDNQGVRRFYREMGFNEQQGYRTPEGRAMVRLRRKLVNES